MEQQKSKVITISINSVLFKTTYSNLNMIEGTRLSNLDKSSDHFDKNLDIYCFDRDPELFRHILNIYRNKEVHFPRNICPILFKKELEFWDIPLKLIAPCCWKYLYEAESNLEDLHTIIDEDIKLDTRMTAKSQIVPVQADFYTTIGDTGKGKDLSRKPSKGPPSKLWLLIEEPTSSTAALIWCYVYIVVALISVVLYVIWLNPSCRVSRYLSKSEDSIDAFILNETEYQNYLNIFNEKMIMAGSTDPHLVLFALDIFCLTFFITEVLLSLCVCPDFKKYFSDGYNLIKLFVTLSMGITFVLEFFKDEMYGYVRLAHFMVACRCFNVLRLVLVFRFRKIYNALHVMLLALKHSLKELLLLVFIFLIAVVVYGCLIFSAEIESDIFPSTQISMWWALITMTTIGYGDYYPVSSVGYLVGALCAINGIVVLAMPIAAIAGTFSNFFSRNSELQRHKLAIKNQNQPNVQDK